MRRSPRNLLPSARWRAAACERLSVRWRVRGANCAMRRGGGARAGVRGVRLSEQPRHARVCVRGVA
eukprot:1600304-Lingulodinium_polyedra.AAC.1